MGTVETFSLGIRPLTQSPRKVYVYLPDGYEDSRDRYPVLYMDHLPGGAVLDAAARIQRFDLGQHNGFCGIHLVDAHERRTADRLNDIAAVIHSFSSFTSNRRKTSADSFGPRTSRSMPCSSCFRIRMFRIRR